MRGISNRDRLSPSARYWPAVVHVDPPRRPDGTTDIPALCRQWDDQANSSLTNKETPTP